MRREKYGQQSWCWLTPKPLFAIYALFAIYYIHVFEPDSCKKYVLFSCDLSVWCVWQVSYGECRPACCPSKSHLSSKFKMFFGHYYYCQPVYCLKQKLKMTVNQKLFSISSNKNVKISKVTDIPVIFNPEWWLESLELVLWSNCHRYTSSSNCDFRNRVLTSSFLV